jgi:membrane-associated phospholipid phosphatase
VKTVLKNNLYFILPYCIFLLAGGVHLLLYSRSESHLFFNSLHHSFSDAVSPYITWLGDGLVSVIITVLLLWVSFRYAMLSGISFLIAALIVQLSRRTVFQGWPRPVKFFEGTHDLHLVPDVTVHSYNTFPSGHTATAFALYFCLSLMVKNNVLKLLFFILALLAACSRVYLSQHFFADVYFSSLIGMFSALAAYFIVSNIKSDWPGKSLLTISKKNP